jgi:hypothetical protein
VLTDRLVRQAPLRFQERLYVLQDGVCHWRQLRIAARMDGHVPLDHRAAPACASVRRCGATSRDAGMRQVIDPVADLLAWLGEC